MARLRGTNLRWRQWQSEKGQALVLVALAMFVLLGFGVLIFDAGFAYVARRHQQNAADAAAMSCARLLAMGIANDSLLVSEIDKYADLNSGRIDWATDPPQYADANGHPLGRVGAGSIPSGASGVLVRSRSTLRGIFAQLFGIQNYQVAALAAAVSYQAAMPTAMGDLIPLAVPKMDFLADRRYNLWTPHYGSYYGVPADWKGVLDYSGFSTHTVCPDANKPANANCWTTNGLDGVIRRGDSIPFYKGDLGRNVAEGLRAQVNRQNLRDSGGKFGIVYLPIYDRFNPDIEKITVWGFAAFKIYYNDIDDSSSPGVFVSYVTPDGKVGDGGGVSYGPRVVKLVPPDNFPTPLPTSTAVPTPPAGSERE